MKKIFLALFTMACTLAMAQQKQAVYPAGQQELQKLIIALDTEAFTYFNTCDLQNFKKYFTDDLEFYHDKGGVSKTLDAFIETTRKNLCGTTGFKIRREAVPATFKVYPLDGYGAILTGEHLFYETTNGIERLSGNAKFTHVWLYNDGTWKMARILSYDHKAVTE